MANSGIDLVECHIPRWTSGPKALLFARNLRVPPIPPTGVGVTHRCWPNMYICVFFQHLYIYTYN